MRYICIISALLVLITAGTSAEPVTITHGPILGRLSDDGIGVWARTSRPGAFRVLYGTTPKRLDHVSPAVHTSLAHDNTGWVHIRQLQANTLYHYQVVTDEHQGPGGSFRTLPNTEMYRDPALNPQGLFNFSFEFACGNNQNPGHSIGPTLPAFKTMLDDLKGKIHFSILNGDWLYENMRDYPSEQWLTQVGAEPGDLPDVVRHAPTITGVWENYKLFLNQGENLAAYHREVPTFFTFDDHEILNDVWGAGTPGLRDRRAAFRDIGVQAWYDYLGWSNPIAFDQGILFGQAQLRAGSSVLLDPDADFTELDLEQAANLMVHWGGPTAGVNDNALDGVGGDPRAF